MIESDIPELPGYNRLTHGYLPTEQPMLLKAVEQLKKVKAGESPIEHTVQEFAGQMFLYRKN